MNIKTKKKSNEAKHASRYGHMNILEIGQLHRINVYHVEATP